MMMKHQKNVQQQIAERKSRFLGEAKYWRKQGLPLALQELLLSKNIDITKVVVFDYEKPRLCFQQILVSSWEE